MKRSGQRAREPGNTLRKTSTGNDRPVARRAEVQPNVPLVELLAKLRVCDHCITNPDRTPLPHAPRPVFQISVPACPRVMVCSQAPGTRAHASGIPFNDPSGVRLRKWMSVTPDEFYDASRVAIVPMGFCFPGLDAKGGDLPPRNECARLWRSRILDAIGTPDVLLLVGHHAQRWHLGSAAGRSLTETVSGWRQHALVNHRPSIFPLPHPSWRNNAWLKANPWFSTELLPAMRSAVRNALDVKAG